MSGELLTANSQQSFPAGRTHSHQTSDLLAGMMNGAKNIMPTKRQRVDEPIVDKSMKRQVPWTVSRCASNGDAQRRKKLECEAGKQDWRECKGTSISAPGKAAVSRLQVEVDGVYTEERGGLFGAPKLAKDYNHFRSCGYSRPPSKIGGTARSFKPNCNDRAVSISTAAAYDALRAALPDSRIGDGDLGENIVVVGVPSYAAGDESGWKEGARLRLGERVVIELTEANMPCYRMQYVAWHASALAKWPREDGKWWRHPSCPLSKEGGRGWLGRVLVAGEVTTGDEVALHVACTSSAED